MFGVELGGKSQPAPTVVPQEPDFGSMGLGPAYRSLMTSAMPTISFTSLPYTASPPRAAQLNTKWKCVSRPLTRSLRVGLSEAVHQLAEGGCHNSTRFPSGSVNLHLSYKPGSVNTTAFVSTLSHRWRVSILFRSASSLPILARYPGGSSGGAVALSRLWLDYTSFSICDELLAQGVS
jgi:hypothetical protein